MMQQHLMMNALRQHSAPVGEVRHCVQCGTSTTPQWREGPSGPKTLCNACGVRRHRTLKRGQKPLIPSAVPRVPSQRQVTGKQARRAPHSGATCGHSETSEEELEWDAEALGNATDDTDDERTAALNLLCFAGAAKKPRRAITKPLRYAEASDAIPAVSGSASGSFSHAAAPASAAGAPMPYYAYPAAAGHSQPAAAAVTAGAAADGAMASSNPAGPMGGRGDPELHVLHQLYCIVQQACRDLAAADTAKEAVARVLAQKQEESVRAREEAERYSRLLNVEVREVSRYLPEVSATVAGPAAPTAPANTAAPATMPVHGPMALPAYPTLPHLAMPASMYAMPTLSGCAASL